MFNLENQIPKLCHLAQEMGEKEKIRILHAAGLQALSSMVLLSLVMPVASNGPIWGWNHLCKKTGSKSNSGSSTVPYGKANRP
jgi:hypothetical protein